MREREREREGKRKTGWAKGCVLHEARNSRNTSVRNLPLTCTDDGPTDTEKTQRNATNTRKIFLDNDDVAETRGKSRDFCASSFCAAPRVSVASQP